MGRRQARQRHKFAIGLSVSIVYETPRHEECICNTRTSLETKLGGTNMLIDICGTQAIEQDNGEQLIARTQQRDWFVIRTLCWVAFFENSSNSC